MTKRHLEKRLLKTLKQRRLEDDIELEEIAYNTFHNRRHKRPPPQSQQ